MADTDTGGRDRLALAVLVQYRMATTAQMHLILSPEVRIEQTRRRLAKLRGEGLIDRVTLPQAGRTRVWHPTPYGAQIAGEGPELRGRRPPPPPPPRGARPAGARGGPLRGFGPRGGGRAPPPPPPRGATDRTAVRLKVGHGLTVTETALAFLQDARRRGDVCRPLDWIPEVRHPLGGGEGVIPDALLYYQRRSADGASGADGAHRTTGTDDAGGAGDTEGTRGGVMQRAFIEVDRATMGPERLAAKLGAYARLHSYAPAPAARPRQQPFPEPMQETWRQRYPLFPRLLFVLDGTGRAGVETRIHALRAAARDIALAGFLREVPVLAVPLADLLRHGPAAPVWQPIPGTDHGQRVDWMHTRHP
ncbi:replication-relaxation family protein [Streptomyces viridosporus]|uniref:replication-relaxation family protein n=1 Tax=Streptomyces viridosporus TaxID=67581 RepID=UPI0036FE3C86